MAIICTRLIYYSQRAPGSHYDLDPYLPNLGTKVGISLGT